MAHKKASKQLNKIKNENGASAVEFAIVLVLLFTIVLGIIQFGFIFYHYISITHAAREGARWAALEQPINDVKQKVKNSAPGLTLNDSDIQVIFINGNTIGEPVKVTVQYKSPIIAPLIGNAMGISGNYITLTSSATQRIE